jgi:hypothetical protein
VAQLPQFINWLTNQPVVFNMSFTLPNTPSPPTTSSYTARSSDYMNIVSSASAGGALTLTLQTSVLPSGFTFMPLRSTNNIVLTPTSGNVNSRTFGSGATVTMNSDGIIVLTFDGTNYWGT